MDIIFLSYQESNAEENWRELSARFPRAKRVHGIKGLYNAHRRAAEISQSEFFFLVDGDNKIMDGFHFELGPIAPDLDTIYVWRCRNPINNLVYGYGAVKLYNKSLLSDSSKEFRDLATIVAKKYQVVHEVASETHFFPTPLEAWRGAFRECAKLQSQVMEDSDDTHSKSRLEIWLSQGNPELKNSDWVLKGAGMGAKLARESDGDPAKIKSLINDFEELNRIFSRSN